MESLKLTSDIQINIKSEKLSQSLHRYTLYYACICMDLDIQISSLEPGSNLRIIISINSHKRQWTVMNGNILEHKTVILKESNSKRIK